MTEFKTPQIHAAMIQVMELVGPISKDRKNQAQGYLFRGIDDFYEALQPIMVKAGVYTTSKIVGDHSEDRQSAKGGTLVYRILTIEYTFWCAFDGSFVTTTVIGEGMDSGDKASNKAMAVAHKYALMQAFAIPTVEPKDPEYDHHDVAPKQTYNKGPAYTPKPVERKSKPVESEPRPMFDEPAMITIPMTAESAGAHVISFGLHNGKLVSALTLEEATIYCGKVKSAIDSGAKIQTSARRDYDAVKTYFGI